MAHVVVEELRHAPLIAHGTKPRTAVLTKNVSHYSTLQSVRSEFARALYISEMREYKFSPKIRAAMAARMKGNQNAKGSRRTELSRKRMSDGQLRYQAWIRAKKLTFGDFAVEQKSTDGFLKESAG